LIKNILTSKEDSHRIARLVLIFIFAWFASRLLPESEFLSPAGRMTAFIFFTGAILWLTETLPAFATAMLIAGMNVLILGKPDGVFATNPKQWTMFITPFVSPIILIFFGGFMMAVAIEKYGLDKTISRFLVSKSKGKPKPFMIIIMIATALFSMFMSNTATTAMMFALVAPIIASLPSKDNKFKAGLGLAIAFAANLGGIGTLIGTPPNGIAVGNLSKASPAINITFNDWLMVGFPFAIVLLVIAYFILIFMYKPSDDLVIPVEEVVKKDKTPRKVYVIAGSFLLTVVLWITSSFTGIPAAVAAMVPVLIFTATGIITNKDLSKIDWPVLLLVGGALSLSTAIKATGFGEYFLSLFPMENTSPMVLVSMLIVAVILLSNFMSNTAAAAMLIPMVIAIPNTSVGLNVVAVGVAASLAMTLPISTPPNAIAFSKGEMTSKQMAKSGTIVTIFGVIFLIAFIYFGSLLKFPGFLFP
jgi:sodium-dependent dicarboxylate transporter 2/3/5